LSLGLFDISHGQLDQPGDILGPFFSDKYDAEINSGLIGGFLNSDLLIENKFGGFGGFDFFGNGVTRMLELHFTGELDFHLD
jgi:hypothetical protein